MSAPQPADAPFLPLPEETFACISIDPPWHFQTRAAVRDSRGPDRHYATTSITALEALPVANVAAPDCHLFMWITGPLLVHGAHLRLFDAWGFRPSSIWLDWVKTKRSFDTAMLRSTPLLEEDLHFGMGYTTRQNAEWIVLGRRGSPKRLRADIPQVLIAPVREHSRKPDEAYARIEAYCEGPRLDMFAGAARPGWTRWGINHRESDRA